MNEIVSFIMTLPPEGALFALFPLTVCALLEDRKYISAFAKLVFQIAAIAIFLALQGSSSLLLSQVPQLSQNSAYIVTGLWMLATFNALGSGFVDDDVLVTVAFISSCTVALLGYGRSGAFHPLLLAAPMGFLFVFNWLTGSVRLGRTARTVITFFAIAAPVTMPLSEAGGWWSPLLLFAYPLLDAVFVLFGRLAKGAPLFAKQPHSLQDCLLKLGLSQKRTRILLSTTFAYCAASALLVSVLEGGMKIVFGSLAISSVVALFGMARFIERQMKIVVRAFARTYLQSQHLSVERRPKTAASVNSPNVIFSFAILEYCENLYGRQFADVERFMSRILGALQVRGLAVGITTTHELVLYPRSEKEMIDTLHLLSRITADFRVGQSRGALPKGVELFTVAADAELSWPMKVHAAPAEYRERDQTL